MNHLRPLAPLLVAMLTGCQLLPSTPAGESRTSAPARVATPGIGQAIDPDTGQAYYVVCDPCLKPTPKTRMPPPQPVAVVRPPELPAPVTVPAPALTQPPQPVAASVPAATAPTPAAPAEAAEEPAPQATKRFVPFAFSRARLGPQGRDAMATLLDEAKTAARVHVRGYTDIIGQMPANKALAMSRAAEVRAALISGGVDRAKITTSYCIDCFIESNETDEGRAANRRALVVFGDAEAVDLDRRDPCRLDGHQVVAAGQHEVMKPTNHKGM